MNTVLIGTQTGPLKVLLSQNDTTANTAIADPADTKTNPAGGAGVIPWGLGGAVARNGLMLVPFGTDTADQTFLMSVFALDRILGAPLNVPDSWTYKLLASFTCTLCTKAGLAGTAVNASQLYCDTIAIADGNENVSVEIISPTGDQAGHVVIDAKAPEFVAVKFARNNSAASMNALWRQL